MQTTCKARATEWVHTYAAGGAAIAALAPIPGLTTASLGAAETHLIYWVAKIYGEELGIKEITLLAGGLEIGGFALKAAAMEACNFIPIAGWIVKGAIAASAIETIGRLIVRHFEQKYPGRLHSVDPNGGNSPPRK